jgi:hypothetical protein
MLRRSGQSSFCSPMPRGLGKGFLDQDLDESRVVIDTNVTGTIYLIQKVGRDCAAACDRFKPYCDVDIERIKLHISMASFSLLSRDQGGPDERSRSNFTATGSRGRVLSG